MDRKDDLKRLNDYIDSHRDEIVQFLVDFIAKKSVTYHEQDAVQFLREKMEQFGFDEVRVDAVGNVLDASAAGRRSSFTIRTSTPWNRGRKRTGDLTRFARRLKTA
jgi:acetylornithine deacetylase/succinyl-diaminopimelate desuccinylase-like protein